MKQAEILASDGQIYSRQPIRTHFIQRGENYLAVLQKYVLPRYQTGDLVVISEKMISICQNNVLEIKNIKISRLTRWLATKVEQTPAGEAMGNPYKLQTAVNLVGWPRILFAAATSVIGKKVFHRHGWFYLIAGREVAGIDGVCADAFKEYLDLIILNPRQPNLVCQQVYEQLGMSCALVDANDLGVEILGMSPDLKNKLYLKSLIADNPAGQSNEQTPLILIRKTES